jgi:thiamine-monophosphate kinase
MTEQELIARLLPGLATNASVRVGAGDDCAVLDLGLPGQWVLFKTDAVMEGIHFTPDTEPARIGHKALARCLSDVAAMGGRPTQALVTLGLPRDFEIARVEAIYAGLNQLAARYDTAVVGGETIASPERTFLSVALLGTVEREKCLLRSGAQSGDGLFVSGQLGGSLQGRHLDFEPRIREAQWLAQNFEVHSMIDLSDGLATDLRHILKASGVGAELLERAIPISRAARLAARAESSSKPPLLAALTDGEDFELLFTLPAREAVRLLDGWKASFPGVPLSCIGRITSSPGLVLRNENGARSLNVHGFSHFS